MRDPAEKKSVVTQQLPKNLCLTGVYVFYPQWGSLLTDEPSLAVWGLQGSPGAMLDSILQQGIARTPWDDGLGRPELVQMHLGLNLSPTLPAAPPVLSCCGNPAQLLQCLELFVHRALHQGLSQSPSGLF